jgi:predicted RNA-binding Zn ribbon-like protein
MESVVYLGAIELVAGPDGTLVRRYAHAGCEMLFVQRHHRRHFCHESCAHRARQSRYAARLGKPEAGPR